MSKSVIDILEELEATSGSLAKREILTENIDNELLKRTFVAAQDPYTVYYVNKFKAPKALDKPVANDDKVMSALLDVILPQLSGRELTGNAAKELLWMAYQLLDERQQKWYTRIILRNLRVGVQESSVNKVWPGTLKSFACALAETLKSTFVEGVGIKLLEPVTYPVRVEPKLDGLRCVAVKQGGVVTFYTRNGTVLETLPKIKAALEGIAFDNIVLDGEAMGDDWNESASVLMAKKTKHDDSNIMYNVFDAMPLDAWIEQKCDMVYADRVEFVKILLADTKDIPVRQVPHIMAKDEAELLAFFQKCMDEGFEGVMLKTLDTPYKFKRSDHILKLKPVVTYEGVIVSNYEGRRGTKREGLWGGFNVVLPNGVITRLGGGFSDALKVSIQLDGPDSFLGKIVEIEAQPDPMTKDGLTKDGKARFPVFTRFRDEDDVDPKVTAAGVAWFERLGTQDEESEEEDA